MTENPAGPTKRGRISKATAAELLRDAADLDAVGEEMIELEELRQAALDAGISSRAFDLSLTQLRDRRSPAAAAPPPAPSTPETTPAVPRPPRSRISYMGVIGAGTIAGTLAMGSTLLWAYYIPAETVMGAIIGGVGALAGVVTYLRVALGPSRPDRD